MSNKPQDPATELTTHSPEETFELGRSIGNELKEQAVFLLSGDLGSGKTLFTKGLAAGLGIDPADVTSPSFTLVNEHPGSLKLYHVDLYRLEAGSLPELGLEEILADKLGVVVIEWAERLAWMPAGATQINFEWISDTERAITMSRLKA